MATKIKRSLCVCLHSECVYVCVCVCIAWCQWGHRRCDSVGTVTAGCWKRLLCVSLNCRQLLLSRAVDSLCSLFIIKQIIRASPSHHTCFVFTVSQSGQRQQPTKPALLTLDHSCHSWRQPETMDQADRLFLVLNMNPGHIWLSERPLVHPNVWLCGLSWIMGVNTNPWTKSHYMESIGLIYF